MMNLSLFFIAPAAKIDTLYQFSGIIEKLDYVKNLGIDTVWLSPFYKSPMDDFGYDIQDFKDIHDEFGTLQDFDDLITRSRELGKDYFCGCTLW